MNTASSPNLNLYRLVVVHYLVSALCFLILAALLLLTAGKLTGHYFQPHLLAITHLTALGWGTLIIFGAVYQLLPVILETELYSYKLGWLSAVVFTLGLVLLVCSFWHFWVGILMQCSSVLLFVGISLFGINIFLTARQNRDDIHQEFIITACIWLMLTAFFGVLMVFNFRYPFLQKDHLLFLKLHAHMGVAGWFLLLITGVSAKLIPMFLVSKEQHKGLLGWSYYLINTGLAFFVVDTYFFGLNIKTYAAAIIVLAGIVCWLIFLYGCFRSRVRAKLDIPIKHTLLSLLFLVVAIFVLPLIIAAHLNADPLAVSYTSLYGSLLLMGWITSLILGQTFKTLPFIVWTRHYEQREGSDAIPLPVDLFGHKLLSLQFGLFLIFTLSFYTGIFYQSPVLLMIGLACFLAVAVLYLVNVIIILAHTPAKNNE